MHDNSQLEARHRQRERSQRHRQREEGQKHTVATQKGSPHHEVLLFKVQLQEDLILDSVRCTCVDVTSTALAQKRNVRFKAGKGYGWPNGVGWGQEERVRTDF